jgi:hypothetical protein
VEWRLAAAGLPLALAVVTSALSVRPEAASPPPVLSHQAQAAPVMTLSTLTGRSAGSASPPGRPELLHRGKNGVAEQHRSFPDALRAGGKRGLIVMTEAQADALSRLGVFVGEWIAAAEFAGDESGSDGSTPTVRSRFEWALDGQFLLQHTEVPIPGAPDSLAIVAVDPRTGGYTQHYFDSRGVARLYAMSFAGRVWTLTREAPDFSPLDFRQRFTGTFSPDQNTIAGAWEMGVDGGDLRHDFALTYRRVI